MMKGKVVGLGFEIILKLDSYFLSGDSFSSPLLVGLREEGG